MTDGNSGLFWDVGFEMGHETDQNNAGKEVNALTVFPCPTHTQKRPKLHTKNMEI